MEIIGHRGAKGIAPENTLESFSKALEFNVDAIETDLRVHEGIIVLSHEATLKSATYTKLSDLLKLINGKVPINLEIKEASVIPLLKSSLSAYNGEIIFSSFEYSILKRLKKVIPEGEIAVLEKWSGIRAISVASLLDTNRIHIKQTWLWSNFVRSLNHKGYRLYAYTVNDTERAEELEEWGVTGIFTDYPDRFRKKIKQ
jgi:glycerophosphoryl diester phosphodiesterase